MLVAVVGSMMNRIGLERDNESMGERICMAADEVERPVGNLRIGIELKMFNSMQ